MEGAYDHKEIKCTVCASVLLCFQTVHCLPYPEQPLCHADEEGLKQTVLTLDKANMHVRLSRGTTVKHP